MASTRAISVPLERVSIRRHPSATIVVMGNPNSGKSTLFNRLTGLRQSTGNYPGVTVEKHTGIAKLGDAVIELIDLPGTFSLGAHSMEERIAVDVVLGRMPDVNPPAGILAVVAMNNLYQGLFLVQQLGELGLPLVVALTMSDAAEAAGVRIDIAALEKCLGGAKVCPVVATTGQGLGDLRQALAALPDAARPDAPAFWPELRDAALRLLAESSGGVRRVEIERALIDDANDAEHARSLGEKLPPLLREARARLFNGNPPVAEEAQRRYDWVRSVLANVQTDSPVYRTWGARLALWMNRPIPGTIGLFVVMAVVFQAVFAWATPLMDAIDAATAATGAWVGSNLPAGAFASLISDGVIAGVGSVIIFLPQIMILFLFIILLEDSGYLARAAYLMDRVMRSVGLSGQSIIPMISSFACAVPGIMATRVIPNRRDRIATILAAPFMTCSARLPVYALLIAAFVPASSVGWFNLQGLVLFGLYLLGIVAGVLTALLLQTDGTARPETCVCPDAARVSQAEPADGCSSSCWDGHGSFCAAPVRSSSRLRSSSGRLPGIRDRTTCRRTLPRTRQPPRRACPAPRSTTRARAWRTKRRRRSWSRAGSGAPEKSCSRCSRRSAGTGRFRPPSLRASPRAKS